MRHAKATDKSQSKIVNELRQAHIQVEVMSSAGNDFPDLLCCGPRGWVLLEVKELDGGKLKRGQIEFISRAKGFVSVVTEPWEAVSTVQDPVSLCIMRHQKDRLAAWLTQNPNQQEMRIKKFFELINL